MVATTHYAIDEAFANFSRHLQASGFDDRSDILVEESAVRRSVTASRNGGALPLVWTPDNQQLTLEISHGSPTGLIAGWFDLYRALLTASGPLPDQVDFTFDSAVAYGLELVRPALSRPDD